MATAKKVQERRFITEAEAEKIKDGYRKMSKLLYEMATDKKKYNSTVNQYANKAFKSLEKWRANSLNFYRMSNYTVG